MSISDSLYKSSFQKGVYLAIIIACITGAFLQHYHECFRQKVPICYDGDAISLLVGVQGYQHGETGVFLPRCFPRLNAPGTGCWSDYPFEKLFSWTAGQLSKVFGLPLGCNLTVLLLQILNGCSFFLCGTQMHAESKNKVLLAACAILFGLAPYAFIRNLNHLALTGYFQLPLFTLFLIWYGWPERVNVGKRGGIVLGLMAGLIGGFLSPYYLGPFLVLLTLLALGKLVAQEWNSILVYAGTVAASFTGFIIQNLDVIIQSVVHGKNHEAVSRNLWWMVKFALYLPDLFFPRAHQWGFLNRLSWSIYQGHVPEQLWGESITAYIGMIAGVGLVVLLICGVAWIAARKFEKVSPYFWLGVPLILFSVAGGINYLLGAFGMQFLRATDRASIMLACFGLYFLCERMPVCIPPLILNWIALLIIPIGIVDQLPKYPSWEENIRRKGWDDFEKDREFFPQLEAMLPKGAMIFELPVKDYPEMGTILEMGDYEHFRPVIHSKELRTSYGTVKGRGDTDWQKECVVKGTDDMVKELQKRGFSAILINRKAYQNKGEDLRIRLQKIPLKAVMENDDFMIFRLPAAQ